MTLFEFFRQKKIKNFKLTGSPKSHTLHRELLPPLTENRKHLTM